MDQHVKDIGIYIPKVREGNCMYFALGMKKFLNRGKIIAQAINGIDSHYGIKINTLERNEIYDGSGRITQEQFLAFDPDGKKELFSQKHIRNKILIEDERFEMWAEEDQKDVSAKDIVDLTLDSFLKKNKLITMNF